MEKLNDYYEFREQIVDALRTDLLGPAEVEEIIDDLPATQYSVGILFPQSKAGDSRENKSLTGGDFAPEENSEEVYGDEGDDAPVALANVRNPSSMGITFAVDLKVCSEIKVFIEAAKYTALDKNKGEKHISRWQRVPLGPVSEIVDLSKSYSKQKKSEIEGLELFVRVRHDKADEIATVTFVLINTLIVSSKSYEERDSKAFFQPEIKVESTDSSISPFVERPRRLTSVEDADLKIYSLIYRNAREFAAGHGCSVNWVSAPDDPQRAHSVATEYIPVYRLPLADSNPKIDSSNLTMLGLATKNRQSVCRHLFALGESYINWINENKEKLQSSDELRDYIDIGGENLNLCSQSANRILEGVKLLENNDTAWEAFAFMNRAMLIQRARSVWVKNGKETAEPVEDDSHRWRPFQIAFILMCLKGIAEPLCENSGRDFVDLLWFPTGGGKTEAYLGLIAFTIFHRRLTNQDGGGVTALMRYTLRLLTIQQFERAAILICACEWLRKSNSGKFGGEQISIGLWVGGASTPNKIAEARTSINKLRRGESVEERNPVQLHSCPWCGSKLTPLNYWITSDNSKMVVSCRQKDCFFKDALPVALVDEDVYKMRPSLLIATADKFARLPWEERTRSLFNFPTVTQSAQIPPELIIQDELHLISGPLGSLAGLYETAIDALATNNGVRPKVIASTATIRRAQDQTGKLFARPMRQFPPPGLDASDSFFAVEADRQEKGDRMYVGLMSPSTSHTTLLVRTYAAVLQAVSELSASDKVKDPYWTLVGYFNSLRVLGGARMQVQDDVVDRMNLLSARHEKHIRTDEPLIDELTSNVPGSQVPQRLKQLSESYPANDVIDVVLATNMISVGVDVDRLGLMAVMGQPQSTSEYIQSTSRVGRQHPGLVLTMYNAARSRDRSHYESFLAYHSALYRQVESTSVTPFSSRARDRGLHAVLIALARMFLDSLTPNSGAANVGREPAGLEKLKEIIVKRVAAVSEEQIENTIQDIDQIIRFWRSRAEQGELVYNKYNDDNKSLLTDATGVYSDTSFPTLNSLRDVDQESNLHFVRESLD
jgi:hypothetical protein